MFILMTIVDYVWLFSMSSYYVDVFYIDTRLIYMFMIISMNEWLYWDLTPFWFKGELFLNDVCFNEFDLWQKGGEIRWIKSKFFKIVLEIFQNPSLGFVNIKKGENDESHDRSMFKYKDFSFNDEKHFSLLKNPPLKMICHYKKQNIFKVSKHILMKIFIQKVVCVVS